MQAGGICPFPPSLDRRDGVGDPPCSSCGPPRLAGPIRARRRRLRVPIACSGAGVCRAGAPAAPHVRQRTVAHASAAREASCRRGRAVSSARGAGACDTRRLRHCCGGLGPLRAQHPDLAEGGCRLQHLGAAAPGGRACAALLEARRRRMGIRRAAGHCQYAHLLVQRSRRGRRARSRAPRGWAARPPLHSHNDQQEWLHLPARGRAHRR